MAKIKLVNSSILKDRDRTMLVNKLHIGCSVACAEGNKQEDAGCVRCEGSIMAAYQITLCCYFCTGHAGVCLV